MLNTEIDVPPGAHDATFPDPIARVRCGDQTWEEMLVGAVTYVEEL